MKVKITNALGDKLINHYVPMTVANAESFATKYLDGTWKVYEALSESGSDTGVVSANDVTIFVKNTESGKKSYLRFYANATKNETELRAALMGLTIDGFIVDSVSIINMSPIAFA